MTDKKQPTSNGDRQDNREKGSTDMGTSATAGGMGSVGQSTDDAALEDQEKQPGQENASRRTPPERTADR